MKLNNTTIDTIIEKYKDQIGKQYLTYKNHVYRIFTLCQTIDDNPENAEKYAIAAAFHDIGIWTHNTFDYLEPSIHLAKTYLIDINKPKWEEEISIMIDMHHKISKYRGAYELTVETFRKADWIDVTRGTMKFNVNKKDIKKTRKDFPILGFHGFLVVQTMKNLRRSPSNPLPMFKK